MEIGRTGFRMFSSKYIECEEEPYPVGIRAYTGSYIMIVFRITYEGSPNE
jgi:hypothetical protein